MRKSVFSVGVRSAELHPAAKAGRPVQPALLLGQSLRLLLTVEPECITQRAAQLPATAGLTAAHLPFPQQQQVAPAC